MEHGTHRFGRPALVALCAFGLINAAAVAGGSWSAKPPRGSGFDKPPRASLPPQETI